MRVYRKGNGSELEKVICNCCGKELKVEGGILREGCFAGDQAFGYFSEKDGDRYRFDLCEACFDKLIGKFKLPVEVAQERELL